jgi:NAD(P)-dependent dehydrogenase (short-subunit alcohol dehydrogenase family)
MQKAKSMTMIGKTVLITGGSGGIGASTAARLAELGAQVVVSCRDIEKGRRYFANHSPATNIDILPLELGSFSSIRTFSAQILSRYPKIDVLINNAGLLPVEYSFTEDGYESAFGVNFLGHFLLTQLLLDRLIASAPARIIHVSSTAHTHATPDLEAFFSPLKEQERKFSWMEHYSQSKLANILYSNWLAGQLRGTGVTSNALHPGLVNTEIIRGFPRWMEWGWKWVSKTPQQGAKTSVYLASNEEPGELSGLYFVNCKPTKAARFAQDTSLAQALCQRSLIEVGLQGA